ncbi:hypothetical protein CI109_100673 [Kwoniella shandongensis]|uniref:Uncharacterized protein n=1 Tax=Kwoniella shandongensis TaxID=1734106 RepID=A0A5M6BZ25_9TREE|nr:uncharacterized protein CI109_003406 [Kwoniella shandongensis]KAA5528118.1 hypothetical protein CI109_003406 [Kwoniella shandongensis]
MSQSLSLTTERATELISQLTDGLVGIQDTTGRFLLRLDDGTVIDTKGWEHPTVFSWEWTHGIALTALCHNSALDPSSPASQKSLKTALDWFETQWKRTDGKAAPKNINTMSPFYSLACFLEDGRTKDEKWLKWCEEWAEYLMNDHPRTEEGGFQHMTYANMHDQNLWDDTLMMSVIPLAKIGILLKRQNYIEEAKYQFLLHIQYLADTVSGLWYHGWEFTPSPVKPGAKQGEPTSGGHNFAKALWARGNCWITVSIPMFLDILGDQLKPEDPLYKYLVSVWKRQVDALVRCQDPKTGLWHTLLVDPTSYVETSATAGFAAGIYMGIRQGFVSDPVYRQTADLALKGVIEQIQPDGQVANVSFGTGMGSNLQFYKDIAITPMPYGQALAMHALVEWQRLQGAGK